MPYILTHHRRPDPWREFRKRGKHPLLIPFLMTEFAAEWTAFFLSRWSFLEVLEYAGRFSILVAVIFYFAESGERTRAGHYQAWMVINTARGQRGSGGRQEALQSLNDDHVSLVGVDVAGASLPGVNLEGADLLRSYFKECDLRNARLAHANFELAELPSANLRDADLRASNFRDANLSDTDLSGANFDGIMLERADLQRADLSNIANWEKAASVEGALIHGVENAPAGFVEWALKHGAIADAYPATTPTANPAK